MLGLLAEKFIKNKERLSKLKEMIGMGIIFEMMREDAIGDYNVEIAKKLLTRGLSISDVAEDTGLDIFMVQGLQAELNNG
jgi:chemotaxis receptor (MCP) glutamine deamidase CheD